MKYGNFDVYIDDAAVGETEVTQDGLLTRIKCKARYESDEILRLAADLGDRYEMLGVMMPKGKQFCMEKCFTKNEVRCKELEKTKRYVLITENEQYKKEMQETHEETDERVWVRCADPAAMFADMECGAALSRCQGVLKSECGEFTYIAVPTEKPFPALPIFYFGQREKLNGTEYLVFTLKDGQLLI
ncbi:MAG: hypothetical protein IJ017_00265 [Oscillospiraceae bacterium]|nr:hypothetical protein [Oscillospiraceae bacterium]